MTPAFYLTQTYYQSDHLPEVGEALRAANRAIPGLIVDYEVRDRAGVQSLAQNRKPLDPLLVDPGVLRFGRAQIGRRDAATWVQRSEPTSRAQWKTMIDEAIAAQRVSKSARLIVPGVEIAGGTGVSQLQRGVAGARAAYAGRKSGDGDWLFRLCAHDEWLRDAKQRSNLLDELSDLPDPFGIALHVRWSRRDIGLDRSSLEALRDTVQLLAADGRDVILLRSGIIGWLATAWGSAGFSAGMSRGSWSDAGRIRGGRATGSTNKEWFFDPRLLRWVERSEHNRISSHASYRACRCRFCRALSSGAAWKPSAAQHSLYALARLAERSADQDATTRASNVRSIIQRAVRDWNAVGAGTILNTRNQAAPHLDLWLTLV